MIKNIQALFQEFIYQYEFIKKIHPETIRGYNQSFSTFLKLVPSVSLENLNTATVTQFFKILHERKRIVGKGIIKSGIKKSTAAIYWTKLNNFFEWLLQNHHIASNPLRSIKYPTPVYEDRKFLKKEQIEKILTAIYLHCDKKILLLKRNLVIFYILLFCGLRREELLLLQIRDIDFQRKILTIRGETSKSGRSRTVPLHSAVIMHLRDYLHQRRQYTTPYLIVSGVGDAKLTHSGLLHLVKRLRGYSKVPFHVHQFRHTFAVNFLKSSNNVAKLQQLLGHRDIRVTMLYLRCLPSEEMRGDIESMNIDSFI